MNPAERARFLDRSMLPLVAEHNGLKVETDAFAPGSLFLRRKVGGCRVAVVVRADGVIDWTATAQLVLNNCFGRGVGNVRTQ
jgi:hypothetical protein